VVAIAVNVPTASGTKSVGLEIAGRAERTTDAICATQDSVSESLSQGLSRHRTDDLGRDGPLDRLVQEPGPLDRFRG